MDFPWIPSNFRNNCRRRRRWQRRSRIRELRWPPRIGEKVAFRTDFGIQIGILREIQQGLVCLQCVMMEKHIWSGFRVDRDFGFDLSQNDKSIRPPDFLLNMFRFDGPIRIATLS